MYEKLLQVSHKVMKALFLFQCAVSMKSIEILAAISESVTSCFSSQIMSSNKKEDARSKHDDPQVYTSGTNIILIVLGNTIKAKS